MNFTSFHFLAFFFVTLAAGSVLRNRKQRIFLLLASYYFYGVFEPWYLILILGSSLIDYLAGLGIEANRLLKSGVSVTVLTRVERLLVVFPRKAWLVISLIMNISLLAYFKYTNFGIEILNDLNPVYGNTLLSWPATHILLPIGISFYTFQSLSYTIDVYRETLQPRRDIIDFFLYVAFFPQLVAGPIVRAGTFFQYLDHRLTVRQSDIIVGFSRIVVGFFRKLVLADNMAICVNAVFHYDDTVGLSVVEFMRLHPLDVIVATFGFGFQIYFDFAGYTDIARGVARIFGFEFDINFLYPMAAGNIKEHWQRWHISLTTWIRDYVYFPLGGSKLSPFRTNFNLFLIWFLTGVWHGAAYHFVAWGVLQAVMLVAHREYSQTRIARFLNERGGLAWKIGARILLLWGLSFGFIYFRAPSMEIAHHLIGRFYGLYDLNGAFSSMWDWILNSGNLAAIGTYLTGSVRPESASLWNRPAYMSFYVLLLIFFVYEYFMNHFQLEYFWKEENRIRLIFLLCSMIFAILVFGSPEGANFLYFQF